MTRRVSGGRLMLWRAAIARFNDIRGELLWPAVVVAGGLVLVNLPWWPPYERGLMTGAVVVTALWILAWVVWVMSGLGHRLNGVMAEDVTNEFLRKHQRTLASLPNYKLESVDIDNVLVTCAAVYAVEVKWRGTQPSRRRVRDDADRLQAAVDELRAQLDGTGIPKSWIRGLLVLQGPGARSIPTELLRLKGQERVRVVSGVDLPAWLDGQDRGMIGPDFAARLVEGLRRSNTDLEAALDAGPVLRWLARTR